MKKIVVFLLSFLVLTAGCLISFANDSNQLESNAPLAFYENDGYKYSLTWDYSPNGNFDDMGGGDGIGDKTQFQTLDCDMFIRALTSFETVAFPVITKVGFYVVDTQEYIWVEDADIFSAEDLMCNWAMTDPASAVAWEATCFEICINTSIFPEGAHDVVVVFEYDGEAYRLGDRTDTYGGGCCVTKIVSSGSGYTASLEPVPDRPVNFDREPIYFFDDNFGQHYACYQCDDGESFDDWGGLDGIGDKTFVGNIEDADLYYRGVVAFDHYVYPDIQLGFYVCDTEEYIWLDDTMASTCPAYRMNYVPGVNPATAEAWGATFYDVAINTSIFPEGDHVVILVCNLNGNVYQIGSRSSEYVSPSAYNPYCFVMYVKSSGSNYNPIAYLDSLSVDLYGQTFNVNISLDMLSADDISMYSVFIDGEEAVLIGDCFVTAALDLKETAKSIDIELYKDGVLVDFIYSYSLKAYFESLGSPIAADILAIASALDVYTGGEGFTVVGASEPSRPADPGTKTASRTSSDDYVKSTTLIIDEDVNVTFHLVVTNATKAVISASGVDVVIDGLSSNRIVTADISLADLYKVYTIKLYVEDTEVACATYSVMDYVYKYFDDADVGDICKALCAISYDLNPIE